MFTLDNFYKSKEWLKLRAALMIERVNERGDLLCAYCGKPINKAYDCIAHHKIELTDDNVNDYRISLNPDLVELIHHRCHNIEHQRFEGGRRMVYLVYGSPCSGKSTWVHDVANPDDLIVDIDSIWEAVSLSDRYYKPNRLKANVFGVRDCLIEQIKTRKGNWRNAYIIGGYPLKTDRDRLCDKLGASSVFIDTERKTCLERAKNEEWKEYISDWFDSFVPDLPPIEPKKI